MRLSSQQYANLADHSYGRDLQGNTVDLAALVGKPTAIDGVQYKVLAHADEPSGYQGSVYQRVDTGEIVVAHRGTEFGREFIKDGGLADGGMVFGRVNSQARDAIELTREVLQEARKFADEKGTSPPEVTVTGHSLGGALAQITAHYFDLRGETFNAYGAASHVTAADVVSSASPHDGRVQVYAMQREVDTITASGYLNTRWPINLPFSQPVAPAIGMAVGGSHDMHNYLNVDGQGRTGVSALGDPAARALAERYDAAIDKYRGGVQATRGVITCVAGGPAGLARDLLDGVRGDLEPGEPARREAEAQARQSAAQTFLGVGGGVVNRGRQTEPSPNYIVPGAQSKPLFEMPDYLQPNQQAPTRTQQQANEDITTLEAAQVRPGPELTQGVSDAERQRAIEADRAPSDAIPANGPIDQPATLAQGAQGAAVLVLQTHLRTLNHRHAQGRELEADGDFGRRTRQAVEQFQELDGRAPTGIADADTLNALQARAEYEARKQVVAAPIAQTTEAAPEREQPQAPHPPTQPVPTAPSADPVAPASPVPPLPPPPPLQVASTLADPSHPEHRRFATFLPQVQQARALQQYTPEQHERIAAGLTFLSATESWAFQVTDVKSFQIKDNQLIVTDRPPNRSGRCQVHSSVFGHVNTQQEAS